MRVGIIELIARALIEHVGIDPVGPQQRHALLSPGTLPLQSRELAGQRNDLLIEFLPRIQAVFAGIGVEPV